MYNRVRYQDEILFVKGKWVVAYRNFAAFDLRMVKKYSTGEKEEAEEDFHNFHELFYMAEGECTVFIGHRIFRIQAGDFALIPAGTLHKTDYISKGQNTKYVLSFSIRMGGEIDRFLGEQVVADVMGQGHVSTPMQRREHITTLLNRMFYEYENSAQYSKCVCKACLAELMLSIARYGKGDPENAGDIRTDSERMQAVASYIYENAHQELSLEELARVFALSPSHLSRTFKAETGFGIKEYIIRIRMRRAAELLLTTELSVTEVAQRCGFNDSNYFGDAFKRTTGLSPREYRKLG